MSPRPVAPAAPSELVTQYERSVPAEVRRRGGVHYTPVEVADEVLDLAWSALGRTPERVCDPTCGGGAFLLRVAERLAGVGVPPEEVVRHRLVGCDVDPRAVAVARAALSGWAAQHGASVDEQEVRVHVADALQVRPSSWPGRPDAGFDLVVGNPPFLSQLATATARDAARRRLVEERFGALGAYADDAGAFLLAAVELAAVGGVIAMVQPQSLLSARDAAVVRDAALDSSALVGMWAHAGSPFPDAAVHVCAPVLRRHGTTGGPAASDGPVEVRWQDGAGVRVDRVPSPMAGARWSRVLGPAHGVPEVPLQEVPAHCGARIGDVATATAGFRDEFYALCDAMRVDGDGPRLVTVGMVDPCALRWGTGEHRLGGRRVSTPRLDVDALSSAHPRVATWVAQRRRPKVLVATQTKVIEAVADADGWCVPVTPTISVEPMDGQVDVWHLVAALSAPPVAAAAVRELLGSGRSGSSVRWSARALLDVPLPVDERSWDLGAAIARAAHDAGDGRGDLLVQLGVTMTQAYGIAADHAVVSWWSDRLPRR